MDKVKKAFPAAFSLIELLAVMAVIALVVAVTLPAFTSLASGSNLNRAGRMVGDQIALARQEAVARNRDVQVTFYNLTNGMTKGWRGMRILRIDQTQNGMVTNAASRIVQIPEGIIISPEPAVSPLLTAGSTGTTNLPGYGTVEFSSFRFRANGSLESGFGTSNNSLTLQNANAQGSPPANYYTIQVNPLTGKVSVYRP